MCSELSLADKMSEWYVYACGSEPQFVTRQGGVEATCSRGSSDSDLACDSCQLGAPPASPSPHLGGRLAPGHLIDKETGAKWRVGRSATH